MRTFVFQTEDELASVEYRIGSEGISRASREIQYRKYSRRGGYEGYVANRERDKPSQADREIPTGYDHNFAHYYADKLS
jgi:hypothetical protein